MARARTGRIAGAWLAAFLLAEPASAQPAPAPAPVVQPRGEPRPAIWLLADADTRIYLFGTIHVLQRGVRWRSAAFDRIAREAQELVLEVSDRELEQRLHPLAMMQLGKTVPVRERISPDRREALARLMRELQLPEDSLDSLQTWAVAMILSLGRMAREGAGGKVGARQAIEALTGVETVLIAEFRASRRPISGAETTAGQLSAFRAMPLNLQRAMLDEAIDAYTNGAPTAEPPEADWVNGNVEGIGTAMEAIPPQLYETLLTRRNRGFADWLVRRLDRPGTVLFAIGAGHLAGRASVQTMLESRGFTVRRIH